jgi:hypothetical protein
MTLRYQNELPLKRTLGECDPDGFVSVADLRCILRCSRGKLDAMTRQGKLRKYYFGGNVRFSVQDVLGLIEDATGERPNPWENRGAAA